MVDMTEQESRIEELRFNCTTMVHEAASIIAGKQVDDLATAGEFLAKSPGIGARSETPFPQLESLS